MIGDVRLKVKVIEALEELLFDDGELRAEYYNDFLAATYYHLVGEVEDE